MLTDRRADRQRALRAQAQVPLHSGKSWDLRSRQLLSTFFLRASSEFLGSKTHDHPEWTSPQAGRRWAATGYQGSWTDCGGRRAL